jgi:sugar transferase (PEP-CTERM/EpsH1 system associated)
LTDILFLTHRVPYPPDKGDRIRTYHILRFLARRARVHLACLADEPVPDEALAALDAYCARVGVVRLGRLRWLRACGSVLRGRTVTEGAFAAPALRAMLRSWVRETPFSFALASSSGMAPYLRLPELRDIPAVVDLIDVNSQKWLDYAAAKGWPKSWLYRMEGRRLRRLEQSLPGWARAVTLVSEAEADLYREGGAESAAHAIGNGVDLDYFRPSPKTPEQGCVFVGALDYHPNVDGARWFCREVWPQIYRVRPEARLVLVGRQPVPAVRRLAELPGVAVVGQVPDVRPHVAGAAVSIVPLRLARGVQNKVLEALAMGKATVASPQAAHGLGATPGQHLLVASTPSEWVETILGLLDDPTRRRRLGALGRQYVEENHRWDQCLEALGPLLGLPSAGPLPRPSSPTQAASLP